MSRAVSRAHDSQYQEALAKCAIANQVAADMKLYGHDFDSCAAATIQSLVNYLGKHPDEVIAAVAHKMDEVKAIGVFDEDGYAQMIRALDQAVREGQEAEVRQYFLTLGSANVKRLPAPGKRRAA